MSSRKGYGMKKNRPVICHNEQGLIMIGNLLIVPDPQKPEKVVMRHVLHGEAGEFSAQALCDEVEEFFWREF